MFATGYIYILYIYIYISRQKDGCKYYLLKSTLGILYTRINKGILYPNMQQQYVTKQQPIQIDNYMSEI